jgi:NADPH:quinone reductase-like Zn-dependent oxidoreductase
MRAAVIRRYGGPEVLAVEDRPEPAVGGRDVLIDVRAASLNPVDFKLRERKVWPVLRPSFPLILGFDVAGVVAQVGSSVTRFSAGDEVYARLDRMGGLAEQVAAAEHVVALKPLRATFEEAAAVPLAGLTALQALREAASLQPGQRVLIHAGAGGVGSLAIQIAKILALHVSTTTSGKNADFVRSLGADRVVDYTKEDVAVLGRDLDAVLDTIGPSSEIRSMSVVKPGGVVVGVSGLPEPSSAILPWFARPIVWLRTRSRREAAARTGVRFVYLWMRADSAQLAELSSWIDAGRLRPVVHRTYPLAEAREAFAELERGHARGKIVVVP